MVNALVVVARLLEQRLHLQTNILRIILELNAYKQQAYTAQSTPNVR